MSQERDQIQQSLIKTIEKHLPERVRALLAEGADPNFRPAHGNTPLMTATNCNHLEAIDILLECGADVRAVDNIGYTALHHAFSQYESPSCARCIEKLIQAGALVDAQDNLGRTPLTIALKVGQKSSEDSTEAIHILLDRGANPWLADQKQETPYMLLVDTQAPDSCLYQYTSVGKRMNAMALQAQMEQATLAANKDSPRGLRL